MPNLFRPLGVHIYTISSDRRAMDMHFEPYGEALALRWAISNYHESTISMDRHDLEELERTLKWLTYVVRSEPIPYVGYSPSAMRMRLFSFERIGDQMPVQLRWTYQHNPKCLVLRFVDERGRMQSSIHLEGHKIATIHDLARLWKYQIIALPNEPVLEEGEFYE